MSSSRLRRKLEAEAQKRLAVAQAGGDENAEPGRSRPAAMQRRPLAERRAAHCSTRSALAAESEESFAGDGEDMTMTDCTGLGIIHTSQPKFGGLPQLAQPCTPSVGTGSVSQHKAGRRVNVGVDGETPLQLREVVMTPNEERRARTWQPIALSALHEKSEDEVDSAGCGCTDKEAPAGDGDDTTLDITTKNLADFRHRDSLMISHHRRTPGGGAEQCDDDDDQTVSLQTELGRNAPSGCTSRSCAEQHLREEIARLNAVETELLAQSEYERQRREVAEARVLALEEQMRQHEGGTHDRSEGKASARVQRLEQQIVDMAAELAKLDSIAAKGDYNTKTTKVVHLKNNPVQKAQHLMLLDEARQQLLRENNGDASASAEQVDELKKQLAASEKRHTKLKEVFHKQVNEFRQACLHLLGWEISMKTDSKGNQLYKLTSLYAQAQEDFLVFKKPANAEIGTLDLETTEYANTLRKEIAELQLHQQQASNPPIPNFLSQITHELFHAKTMFTAYRALPLRD